MPFSVDEISALTADLGKKLMQSLAGHVSRKVFFNLLSRLLREHFFFDRLCINLYDSQGGTLTYFTAVEGTIAITLSPVRPAEATSTVAGHVIAGRKAIVITDFAQYFSESTVHPIAEAGLTATMAFPLFLDNEIIATLHCSFAEPPDNIYEIASFFLELSSVISICIGSILSLERFRNGAMNLQAQPLHLASTEDAAIICHSEAMREVMRKINTVAKLQLPVLLLGETGTGKSFIAQHIHRRSLRKDAHFVKVNCPALPQTLFESELFGHAKGAFTGAAGKRLGRFELAHGGTLFLDEIAELTPEMQSKLLQVLEDASFERVGESLSLAVDVRIIAATNVSPGRALSSGSLRSDLYYRISPCTIELPPVRERREDIPLLAASIAALLAQQFGLPPVTFTPELIAPMRAYGWPGNIRELRNVISRLLIHYSIHKQMTTRIIESLLAECPARCQTDEGRLPAAAYSGGAISLQNNTAQNTAPPLSEGGAPLALAEMERRHILATLKHTGGVLAGPSGAAAILGIPRTTLQHRMRKLGVNY